MINHPNHSTDFLLKEAIGILTDSYLYPDLVCGMIRYGNLEYRTDSYQETPFRQMIHIDLGGRADNQGLTIIICYIEQLPTLDDGPFLKEEKRSLEPVARELDVYLERK